ncbi:MAG TPA: CotH kinase family protein [Lachnospiraceae bacterium]|nr:CotH kinase family protein [Lachnospiraceae bacterium]
MRKRIVIALATVSIIAISILANAVVRSMENVEMEQNKGSETITSIVKDQDNELEGNNLPVIYLDTDGKQIYKEYSIWSNITVAYPDTERSSDQQNNFTSAATVKYRGNSSYYNFDKRQYRITFFKKTESTKKVNYALCGMGEHSEWILNGPFLDRTLLRNHLLYKLSKEIMDWAPDSRFCELYLDGEYQGVYLAVEPVSNGESRLRLSEFSLLSGNTAFIIRRERVGEEENALHTYGELHGYTMNELSISYPSVSDLTQAQNKYINQYINKFEQALYGDNFTDSKIGYERYIDVDSFVDYYIINECSMNSDAGELSTYFYRELDGKLHPVVWDFNNAFNNDIWSGKDFKRFFVKETPWFDRLLQDRSFVDKVIKRYAELRGSLLSNENVIMNIDSDITFLGDAIRRNFDVWGYTFNEKLLTSAEDGTLRDPRSYEEAVKQLKEAVIQRFSYLDANINLLYEDCIN